MLKRRHKKRAEYRKMKSAALEREANILLYGTPTVPKRNSGIQYALPKKEMPHGVVCSGCKKPIALGGSGMCRACYLSRAKKKRIGLGKEIVDAEEFERMTAVGYDYSVEGKVFRLMGTVPPDQIEAVWRSQIARAQQSLHRRGIAVSYEEAEEMLDQLSRVA